MALTKVTAGLITANAVVDSFGTQSITGDKIGLTAINANNIVNSAITGPKLGANSVSSNNIIASVTLTTPIISGNLNLDSTGTSGVRLPAANTITFHTTGTEDMRLDSSGNVGIGTASPTARLDVRRNTTEGSIAEFHQSSGYGIDISSSEAIANISSGYLQSLAFRTDPSSGPVERMRITSDGLLQFNSGYGSVATAYGCRAWVNFNGQGTVAIRASGNVSSLTDNGDGDYTVNFSTALSDANYSVNLSSSREPTTGGGAFCQNIATNNTTGGAVAPTSSAIRVAINRGSGLGPADVAFICVSVFR